MASSDLFLYRGLNPEEYDRFQKSGALNPENHSVNERAGKGVSFFGAKEQAILHAGPQGQVISMNYGNAKWHSQGTGGEAALLGIQNGDGYLTKGPVQSSQVSDIFPAADHYDDALQKLHQKGSLPVLNNGEISYKKNQKYKIDNPLDDPRHSGELLGRKQKGGHQWFEPRNVVSSDDFHASTARLNTPKVMSTPIPEVPSPQFAPTIPTEPVIKNPVEEAVIKPPTPQSVPTQARNASENLANTGKPSTSTPKSTEANKPKVKTAEKKTEAVRTSQAASTASTSTKSSNTNPLHPPSATKQQTTVGDIVKGSYGEYKKLSVGGRMRFAGAIGGAAGFLHSRSEHEGLGMSIVDTGIGASASILGSQVLDHFVDQYGPTITESFGTKKKISVGAMTEGSLIGEAEASAAKTARKIGKGFNVGAKGIGALIAVGTLASMRNGMDHNLSVEREKVAQKENIKKKESKQKKTQSELFGYDKPLDMGQLVLDMWDDRIGHHLMGNAKFQ